MADPEFLKQFLVMNARRLGMAGKMLFPIPDRGSTNACNVSLPGR